MPMNMPKNMGRIDRILRLIVAVGAAGLSLTGVVAGTGGILLLVAAAVLVLTSLVGFCPLYALSPCGIRTDGKASGPSCNC